MPRSRPGRPRRPTPPPPKCMRRPRPRRQELLRRLNLAPGGTAALVRMREQLLDALDHREDLKAVDADFVHLFSSWFNRGFLVLRRIDWSTPAMILEKIIRYEAVHRIRSWDDLRRRIDPPDRRCYAFFHPALLDEPLIFVEIALTREIPDAIAPILSVQRDSVEPDKVDDRDVLFDLQLPARTRRRLVRQFPDQAGGAGDFAREPAAQDLRHALAGARFPPLARPGAQGRKLQSAFAGGPGRAPGSRPAGLVAIAAGARADAGAAAARRGLVLSARQEPPRPAARRVARFHLGNGARLERLNWLADGTENGIAQSYGLMVNYLYDLDDIEKNHEAYAEGHKLVTSSAVRRLLRGAAPAEQLPVPMPG